MSSRHLPPMVASLRHLRGPLQAAHDGVERGLIGAKAAGWVKENDTDRPTPDRARALARRTRGYAAKFIAEHDRAEHEPDHAEPTDDTLAACFEHCARRPPATEYDDIRDAIDDQRIEAGTVSGLGGRYPLAITRRGRPWPKKCNFNRGLHDWQTAGPMAACGNCGRIEGVDDVAALVRLDGWLVRLPGQLQAHQEGRLPL